MVDSFLLFIILFVIIKPTLFLFFVQNSFQVAMVDFFFLMNITLE